MESAPIHRSARLTAIGFGAAVLLTGCSSVGGLFGSNASDGE